MRDVKQVIVMRTDLNMRKGKMIAQGAHAACSWLLTPVRDEDEANSNTFAHDKFCAIIDDWRASGTPKICVRVDSEAELDQVVTRARELGLLTRVVTDAGRTEFKGVPTVTCAAIGPGPSDVIDRVTRQLRLL